MHILYSNYPLDELYKILCYSTSLNIDLVLIQIYSTPRNFQQNTIEQMYRLTQQNERLLALLF